MHTNPSQVFYTIPCGWAPTIQDCIDSSDKFYPISFCEHLIHGLSQGFNLANLSIQWHIQQAVFIVLHAICDIELHNAKN